MPVGRPQTVGPCETKTYRVQQMWDLHKEIARRLLIGQKNVDIAADLGISEATVSYTRNSPIVKRQLDTMHGARDANAVDFAQTIERTAGKALQLIEEVIEDDASPLHLRLKAAIDAVDRHIPKVQVNKNFNAHFTAEDIAELKERAINAAKQSSVLVEGVEVVG